MRKLLKPNTVLNLANGLKTLLQDLLLCDLKRLSKVSKIFTQFEKIFNFKKYPIYFFAKSLIDTIYMPVVIYIS